jgi:hypothetical protein
MKIDERFNKKDRQRLTNYNKHRLSGSIINVSYRFANGCEEHQLGRLFPDDSIGLQSFRFDLRNPIAKKYYWDIDIENCHYIIAYRFCQLYSIQSHCILNYINDREALLKMVSNNRKKAKTEFLKILYGGDIKLYNPFYDEVADGEITMEGFAFLKNLQKEIEVLMTMIWNKYSYLHNLKIGQDKKQISKKTNCRASLMSLVFQTEERKILMFIDYLLTKQNRYMGVFIHDGGYVEKLEGETCFPQELLNEISLMVNERMNYKIKLVQKEITYDWTPSTVSLSSYEVRKKEFEKNNFFVGSTFISIHSDGYIEYIKPNDMKIRMRKNNYIVYNL